MRGKFTLVEPGLMHVGSTGRATSEAAVISGADEGALLLRWRLLNLPKVSTSVSEQPSSTRARIVRNLFDRRPLRVVCSAVSHHTEFETCSLRCEVTEIGWRLGQMNRPVPVGDRRRHHGGRVTEKSEAQCPPSTILEPPLLR